MKANCIKLFKYTLHRDMHHTLSKLTDPTFKNKENATMKMDFINISQYTELMY